MLSDTGTAFCILPPEGRASVTSAAMSGALGWPLAWPGARTNLRKTDSDLLRSTSMRSRVTRIVFSLIALAFGCALGLSTPSVTPAESHPARSSAHLARTQDRGAHAYIAVSAIGVPGNPELSRRKPSGNPDVRILSVWEATPDGQSPVHLVLWRHLEPSGSSGRSIPLRHLFCTYLL